MERLFSVMESLWTDKQNRLSVGVVLAKIITNFNYSMSCNEFCEFLGIDGSQKLIKAVKSQNKYRFK